METTRTQFPLSKCFQLSRTTKTKRYWYYNWQIWFTTQNLALWRRVVDWLSPKDNFSKYCHGFWRGVDPFLTAETIRINGYYRQASSEIFHVCQICLSSVFLGITPYSRGKKDGLFCFIGFANTNGEGRSFLILSENTSAVKQSTASPY